MSDTENKAEPKTPPYGLDTTVLPPEKIRSLEELKEFLWFLHSSPSFRRVFYGTSGAMLLALAGTAYVCANGPDQRHNPILNGTAEKLYPELTR